jgi:YVTN family beta-propeller protein
MGPIRRSIRPGLYAALLAVSLTACTTPDPTIHALTPKANIILPKDTRPPVYDLLTLDTRNDYLYSAHLSASQVDIVDTKSGRYIGSIQGTTDIKQIALSSDPNIIYTSDGATQKVGKIDVAKRKLIKEIPVGGSPDAIAYDPIHDLILASLVNIHSLAVIDGKTDAIKANIALPGAPELSAVDPKTGNLYQAIIDQNDVVLIDTVALQIISTFKGCDLNQPKGLAYDPDQGRLFVANKSVLSVIDLLVSQCVGSVDIGSGADQVAFNPVRHHVYVANSGSRNVSVIDSQTFKPVGEVGTGPSAGSVAVDPRNGNVYITIGRAGTIAVYHDP